MLRTHLILVIYYTVLLSMLLNLFQLTCLIEISYNNMLLNVSFQLCIQVCSLNLDMVGVFTPRKLANTINQAPRTCFEGRRLNILSV